MVKCLLCIVPSRGQRKAFITQSWYPPLLGRNPILTDSGNSFSIQSWPWGRQKKKHTLFLIPYWYVKETVLCNFPTAPLTSWGETLSIRGSADYPTCSADRPLCSISISLLKGDSRDWLLLLYSAWPGWDIFRQLPFFPLSSCNHTLSPLRTPGASITDSDHKTLWNDNWSFVGF